MRSRTSETDPIRVDWPPTSWAGRVGLTFAPGKKVDSLYGYRWDRDLDADLWRLRETFETDHLVPLIEDHELLKLGIPDLVERAEGMGMTVHRLPIRDVSVPTDATAVGMLIAEIVRWATAGKQTVIHCRGGLGRAGTIGGCVLVAAGLTGEQALETLREVRGSNCPETEEQRRYILRFSDNVSAT